MARQINATYRMNFVIICFIIPIVLFCSYQIISQSEQNEIVHETVLKHTNITNVTSTNHIRYIDKDVVNINININNEDEDEDNDDADGASRIRKTDVFHFCGNSRVQVMVASADSDNDADDDMIPDTDKTSLSLLYQCSGEPYEKFANILHSFAYNRSITSSYEKKKENDEDGNYNYNNSSSAHNNSIYWKHKEGDQCSALVLSHSNNNILWGQREFPFDDNMTILAIGNSHLRQISKTIACQYAHKIKSIHFLPSIRDSATDDDDDDNNNNNIESFVLEFSNNARWISVTNQVVLYSEEWKELLEEFYLNSLHPPPSSSSSSSSSSSFFTSGRSTERGGLLLKDIDAIIFGKFTTYKQAKGTNFERTMNDEELAYYDYRKRHDKIQQQQQHVELNYPNRTLLRKKGGNKGTRTTSTHQTTTLTSTPIVNFTYILPPDIVGIAKIYNGPIISVSMFSKSYTLDTQSSYDTYRQQCLLLAEKKEDDSNNTTGNSTCIDNAADGNINKNLYLIDSRRYIVEMGIECGTDDKKTIGTCHEPLPIKSLEDRGNQTNSTTIQRYRDPSDMHRCAGARGGHTDLVAWDVIESLYDTRLKNA